MFTIELYLKYLRNSLCCKSRGERTTYLLAEKAKIAKIIEAVDSCFYGDRSLSNRTDNSIYTFIKRDILKRILFNTNNIDEVLFESIFYLNGLLSEISMLDNACN